MSQHPGEAIPRKNHPPITGRVTGFLVQHRIFVLFGAMGFVLLLEIVEHALISIYGERIHFWYDTVIYTLMVPACMWFLLDLLKNTESQREIAAHVIDQRAEFSQRLGDARTYDQLLTEIVQYAQLGAVRANVTMFVFNQHRSRLEPAAICRRDGQVTLRPPISISPDSLPIGSLPQLMLQNSAVQLSNNGRIKFPEASQEIKPILPNHRYDIPLVRNDQILGVLKLEYPLGEYPTQEEIQALKGVAPIIALALEGGILQNLAEEQAEASEAERQKIAQHLHDTLAQNIGYLRLKLDQLTGENSIREIGMVLEELERMRATAEEAYLQVRTTLDELNHIHAEDLSTILVRQARSISQRACFDLRYSQVGTPFALPPATRQQILYITREALHNIEKHAKAHQVHLQFLWLENELILKVTDDGLGFDPQNVKSEGHYGLWIMQHRALEISGSLKVVPIDDHGTEVTLWVPRPK